MQYRVVTLMLIKVNEREPINLFFGLKIMGLILLASMSKGEPSSYH